MIRNGNPQNPITIKSNLSPTKNDFSTSKSHIDISGLEKSKKKAPRVKVRKNAKIKIFMIVALAITKY